MAEAVEYLEANRDVGLVYGDANFINAAGEVIGHVGPRAATSIADMIKEKGIWQLIGRENVTVKA